MADGRRMLTTDELARIMDRPRAQVDVLIRKGCPVHIVQGQPLFDVQEVLNWTRASGKTADQLCNEK